MTSTESLIQSQRDELLRLGFAQPHGFQYTITAEDGRFVVVTRVGREDDLEGQEWEVEVTAGAVTDVFRFVPDVSLRTFRAVISSLL